MSGRCQTKRAHSSWHERCMVWQERRHAWRVVIITRTACHTLTTTNQSLQTALTIGATILIGGRKPPGSEPPVSGKAGRNPQDITPCSLRPPILKFSFQVGDVWFCGFYASLPLNGGFWPGGRGVMSGHQERHQVFAHWSSKIGGHTHGV